jgi:23S rRNA pseudouridine955/2504/2580 synthase
MSAVEQRTVTADDADQRLDRWFRRHFPALSHGQLEKLLRTGQVRVDGRRVKANARVETGQVVRIPPAVGQSKLAAPAPRTPAPVDESGTRDLQRRVLYRDDDVLILDKPAGLAVHGGSKQVRHLDAMLDALAFDKPEPPRLVHRLDQDTSGVLVLARSAQASRWLGEAFRSREARKIYWAVAVGVPPVRQGRIDLKLAKRPSVGGEKIVVDREGGRSASTVYAVVESFGRLASWLALMPLTGRTHQLRVHLAAAGTPILGDGKYGGRTAFLDLDGVGRGLHLHARSIELRRPDGRIIAAVASLPEHMRATWKAMGFASRPDGDPLADFDG